MHNLRNQYNLRNLRFKSNNQPHIGVLFETGTDSTGRSDSRRYVPAPQTEAGTLLVQVRNSCISVGTEMSGIRSSGEPIWKRAMRQPARVKTVAGMIATYGIAGTKAVVEGRIGVGNPDRVFRCRRGAGSRARALTTSPSVTAWPARAHNAPIMPKSSGFRAILVQVFLKMLDLKRAVLSRWARLLCRAFAAPIPPLGENFVVIGLGVLGQMTAFNC